jgi:hypothetical protein
LAECARPFKKTGVTADDFQRQFGNANEVARDKIGLAVCFGVRKSLKIIPCSISFKSHATSSFVLRIVVENYRV